MEAGNFSLPLVLTFSCQRAHGMSGGHQCPEGEWKEKVGKGKGLTSRRKNVLFYTEQSRSQEMHL